MTPFKFFTALLITAALTMISAVACDKPDETEHASGEAEHHADDEDEGNHHESDRAHARHDEDHDMEGEEMGTRHEPPIAVSEVETGHWMCVMGDVHYSRPEEGDGRCPVCGMRLKQKTVDEAEEAAPEIDQ